MSWEAANPRLQKRTGGMWNVRSLSGKTLDLVWEVEKFRQDCSQACLRKAWALVSVFSKLHPKNSSGHTQFLGFTEVVLENIPAGDFIVLLEDFNVHVGDETWKGVIERTPRSEPEGVML